MPNNQKPTEQQLSWLHKNIKNLFNVNPEQLKITPMAGDASSKIYFTVEFAKQKLILVTAEQKQNQHFASISNSLKKSGVEVPVILAQQTEITNNQARSCMLLSHVGNVSFLSDCETNKQNIQNNYKKALEQIHQIQTATADVDSYNADSLMKEANLFIEWFVPNLTDDNNLINLYKNLMANILPELLKQPQALAHRDYHSRNIHIKNNILYTFDFQDAIFAPLGYDLTSLLKDCYIELEKPLYEALVRDFYKNLPKTQQKGINNFIKGFELIGIQRHLKIAGIFVRLAIRDNKKGYLQNIPLCIKYLISACEKLDFALEFAAALKQQQSNITKKLQNL